MPAGHEAMGVTERFTGRHDQCGRAGAGYVRRCNAGNMSIAGRSEASSSVGICAYELHEAFILGALLYGGYRPFRQSSLRVWSKRQSGSGGA